MLSKPIRIILASQSPRRRELMQLVGYPYQAIRADADEDSITHPNPAVNAIQTAALKADKILATQPIPPHQRTLIVAADTIVALDGQMLGKPVDEAGAWAMLRGLRHRAHEVHTGLVLADATTGERIEAVHTAVVTMRAYTDADIEAYIATGDPFDKAGAYAIQHPQFRPVAHLVGCYTGVMGLSVCHLLQALASLAVPLAADLTAVQEAHHHFPCPLYDEIRTTVL